jgi:hypothetical protein
MLIPTTTEQNHLLSAWFRLTPTVGDYEILYNPETDAYTMKNLDVKLIRIPSMGRLPVKFERVGGAFIVNRMGLTSLEGSPKEIDAGFFAGDNNLENLLHAPIQVPGHFSITNNPLTSLEGWPEKGVNQCTLTYSDHLPLLRCLQTTDQIHVVNYPPPQINEILNRHKDSGKAGALKAAAELIRAGFRENARW